MKKETGLMFKAPLVRAILSRQKTQTRRVFTAKNGGVWPNKNDRPGMQQIMRNCTFGQPGDRIYVRETFARVPTVCGSDDLIFAADYQDGSDKAAGVKYTPAIHMPKDLARIWLEVTGVRVERLQSISEEDAKAEGTEPWPCDHKRQSCKDIGCTGPDHLPGFRSLWESTGGDWAANPWVWVIDFKRIERAASHRR